MHYVDDTVRTHMRKRDMCNEPSSHYAGRSRNACSVCVPVSICTSPGHPCELTGVLLFSCWWWGQGGGGGAMFCFRWCCSGPPSGPSVVHVVMLSMLFWPALSPPFSYCPCCDNAPYVFCDVLLQVMLSCASPLLLFCFALVYFPCARPRRVLLHLCRPLPRFPNPTLPRPCLLIFLVATFIHCRPTTSKLSPHHSSSSSSDSFYLYQ